MKKKINVRSFLRRVPGRRKRVRVQSFKRTYHLKRRK